MLCAIWESSQPDVRMEFARHGIRMVEHVHTECLKEFRAMESRQRYAEAIEMADAGEMLWE